MDDKEFEFEFGEGTVLDELDAYIRSTYDQHYATGSYQATDVIIDAGWGKGFLIGNIIKYAKRYGKKGGPDDHRKDILKVLHYAVILMSVHDDEADTIGDISDAGIAGDLSITGSPLNIYGVTQDRSPSTFAGSTEDWITVRRTPEDDKWQNS